MKKTTTLHLLAAAALLLSSTAAYAVTPNPNYIKLIGKYTMLSDMDVVDDVFEVDSDDGWGIGGAIGTQINMFKIEVEIATQKNDINGVDLDNLGRQVEREAGETSIDTLLVNAFLDIPIADGLSVYAGGGAGGAIVSFEAGDFDSDDTVFAYKFAAGLSYAFTPELGADLGYEYLATEDVELDRIDLKDVNSNNIVLALKYMF